MLNHQPGRPASSSLLRKLRKLWSIGRPTAALFVATLLLLISAGLLAQHRFESYELRSQWVAHTHRVVAKTGALLGMLVDAETRVRGYLLAGEQSYLDHYRATIQEIPGEVRDLRDLTNDNPVQKSNLDALQPLIMMELDILAELVESRTMEPAKPASTKKLAEAKKIMDDCRARIEDLRHEEERLLKLREDDVAAGQHFTMVLVILTGLLSVLALIATVATINRSAARQQAAAEVLGKAHKSLEQRTLALSDANIEIGQTFEQLRTSEDHYRFLIEGITDYAIFMLNPAGQVVTWNSGAELVFGFKAVEIIGQSYSKFFHDEDETSQPQHQKEARSGGGEGPSGYHRLAHP